MVFQDESITLHPISYEKESRNISLQCIIIKGKHVIEKWGSEIKIKNSNPRGAMELNRETHEALENSVDDQKKKNSRLKESVAELEVSLIPQPLFSKHVSIVHSIEESLGKDHRFDKVT